MKHFKDTDRQYLHHNIFILRTIFFFFLRLALQRVVGYGHRRLPGWVGGCGGG